MHILVGVYIIRMKRTLFLTCSCISVEQRAVGCTQHTLPGFFVEVVQDGGAVRQLGLGPRRPGRP